MEEFILTLVVDNNHNDLKDTFVINPDGAKNAILPLMISKLLIPQRTTFTNVSTESEDVKTMVQILTSIGLECELGRGTLVIDNRI